MTLDREYKQLREDTTDYVAFEVIMCKYPKLSDMAAFAGYMKQDVEKWRSVGAARNLKTLKREIFYQRLLIYITCIFMILTGVFLLNILLLRSIGAFIFAIICGGLTFGLLTTYRKRESVCTSEKIYDTEAYNYMRALSDKYAKRRINGIVLFFIALSYLIINFLIFYVFGQLKARELLIVLTLNLVLIEVPLYLCLKNIFCFHLIQKRINLPADSSYKKHLYWIIGVSIIYWGIANILALVLRKKVVFIVNVYLIVAMVYVAIILFYNLNLRKKVTFRNIVLNKRRIALYTSFALLVTFYSYMQKDTWYTQPYINSLARIEHTADDIIYNEQTGVYTITASEEDFKILQLTDIHLGGSLYSYHKDINALKAIYAEIEYTRPNLVVITGDLTMPMGLFSFSFNNAAPVGQFAAFMRNIGIPWVFTYGNHDTENVATSPKSEITKLYKSLSYKTSGTLLYPYVQPDITGRSNQLIEIRNADGSLNQALFLIDSNAYTDKDKGINDYDYIHDDQVDWYAGEIERLDEEAGHDVSSMVFFHIPLQQYRTAYELYEDGSNAVKYFFGDNGEKMFDKVCCSDYPSKLFDTMLKLGSTKATFCGHDHYNNMSLEYKGIRLTYGMSIDYLAMPGIENSTAQRGATLITLHSDNSWEVKQIPLTSIVE